MATVHDAAPSAVMPVAKIIGAKVRGRDGETVGKVEELIVEAATGHIVYAALAHGGVLGVGEQLHAVAWSCFAIDPLDGILRLNIVAADLADRPGFDKDAWPDCADAALSEHCGRHA